MLKEFELNDIDISIYIRKCLQENFLFSKWKTQKNLECIKDFIIGKCIIKVKNWKYIKDRKLEPTAASLSTLSVSETRQKHWERFSDFKTY